MSQAPSNTNPVSELSTQYSSALLDATVRVLSGVSSADVSSLSPDVFTQAAREALRAVLTKQFDANIADAYASALSSSTSSSSVITPSTSTAPIHSMYKGRDDEDTPLLNYPDITQPLAPSSPHGKRLIRTYIDGCFDIMHSGHYNAIRQAKALTDILVVGVHSDAEILKHKGPPVMNDAERLATVRACKWVDEVVFDTPYDPSLELLIKLNCDFCVHGDDISTTADGKDAYADVKNAGRMKIVKRTEGVSTTDLVGRLLLMTKQHHIASPALTPLVGSSSSVSPSFAALSSQLGGESGSPPPNFDLEPAALPASAPVAQSATISQQPVATSSTPAASPLKERVQQNVISPKPAAESKHYSAGISNFLPTTWRIAQFSNHKTPTPDDKIVYIDGAFDLFHIGHIQTLKKARALGTFLYVGIHDDATVNHHKGRNYPIMNLHERVMNVLSCKYVDEVVIGAPWVITKDLITTLNLHVVASGTNTKIDNEYAKNKNIQQQDPYATPKSMGIYQEIETTHSLSTDDVIHRLIENRLKYENRNAKRSVKELNYLKGQKTYIPEI